MLKHLLGIFFLCIFANVAWIQDARGQQSADSAAGSKRAEPADTATPYWQKHVLTANTGPSMGSPPSSFSYEHASDKWCLTLADTISARTHADYSSVSARWTMKEWAGVSEQSLQEFLSDSSEEGKLGRSVFGKLPRMDKSERIEVVTDEALCRTASAIVNRNLLGWKTNPPVAVLRARHYLFVFPSRAQLGEWGLVMGLSEKLTILGVGTW